MKDATHSTAARRSDRADRRPPVLEKGESKAFAELMCWRTNSFSETRRSAEPGSSGIDWRSHADCRDDVVGRSYPNDIVGCTSSERSAVSAAWHSGASRIATTAASMTRMRAASIATIHACFRSSKESVATFIWRRAPPSSDTSASLPSSSPSRLFGGGRCSNTKSNRRLVWTGTGGSDARAPRRRAVHGPGHQGDRG